MTKKLIFIDLDGTLLNDSFELTPYTQNVLKRISEKGHKVDGKVKGEVAGKVSAGKKCVEAEVGAKGQAKGLL